LRAPTKTIISPSQSTSTTSSKVRQKLSNVIEASFLPAIKFGMVGSEQLRLNGLLTKLEGKLLNYQCE